MANKLLLDLFYGQLFSQLFFHRCDLGPGQTARDDSVEVGKIRVDVQCQTVKGDPSSHSDPDSCDFPVPDPHSRPRRAPPALQAEVIDSLHGRHLDVS